MKRLLRTTLTLIASTLLFSCNIDVNMMLADYNSNFQTIENGPATAPQPGDSEFHQENMLFDKYIVYNDGTLNLAAPVNSSSIKWEMFDPELEDNQQVSVTQLDGFDDHSQRFVIYAPTSGLEVGKTYQLKLSVIGDNLIEYRDTCEIAIVKTYHTDTGTRAVLGNSLSNSRTIIPTDYNISDLYYYLFYKNNSNNADTGTYIPISVEKITEDLGRLNLSLTPGSYDMVLYGLKNIPESLDLISTSAVVKGKATADLRYSKDSDFILKSEDLTNPGTLQLKLYTLNWDVNTFHGLTVSTQITNSDGSTVTPLAQLQTLSKENLQKNTPPENVNYHVTLKPGCYVFTVIFTYKSKNYVWSDNFVISGQKATESTIGIPLVVSDKEDSS